MLGDHCDQSEYSAVIMNGEVIIGNLAISYHVCAISGGYAACRVRKSMFIVFYVWAIFTICLLISFHIPA